MHTEAVGDPSPDRTDAPPSGRRSRLREIGEEPDPRFSMANERTFLAWNRTALALIAGGLAVAQLLDFQIAAARVVLALLLIALGALASLASYRRWEGNERALRLGRPLPYSPLPRLLGYAVGCVALVAGAFIVLERVLA